MSQSLVQSLVQPIKDAIAESKVDPTKIHSIELVGGPSRVPCIETAILETIKSLAPQIEKCSRTLNGEESVARGCALMVFHLTCCFLFFIYFFLLRLGLENKNTRNTILFCVTKQFKKKNV